MTTKCMYKGGMASLVQASRHALHSICTAPQQHAAAPARGPCALCAALQKALTRKGVPFVLVRDTSLFERKEVKDVMAYAH